MPRNQKEGAAVGQDTLSYSNLFSDICYGTCHIFVIIVHSSKKESHLIIYSMETKPKVLLLGGCGYIGRNLVKYLLQNELVSFIRVADKILPVMAYLHPEMEAIFESPLIQFVQCDLTG